MTHHERLIVDDEVGDLFCDLEPVSKMLSHIIGDLLAPGQELGAAERDNLEALLQLCCSQVENILVGYDMRIGHTTRGITQYTLRLARGAEAAERSDALQFQSSTLALSGRPSRAAQANIQQLRAEAAKLPDADAVKLLEGLLREYGETPEREAS